MKNRRFLVALVAALFVGSSALSLSFRVWVDSENNSQLREHDQILRAIDSTNNEIELAYDRDFATWQSAQEARNDTFNQDFSLWKFENDKLWTQYHSNLNRSQTLLPQGFLGYNAEPRGGGIGDRLTDELVNPLILFERSPGTNFRFGPVPRLTRLDYIRVVPVLRLPRLPSNQTLSYPPTNVTVSFSFPEGSITIERFELNATRFEGYSLQPVNLTEARGEGIRLREGEEAYLNIVAESPWGLDFSSDTFAWFYVWEAEVQTPMPPSIQPAPTLPVRTDPPKRHQAIPLPPFPALIQDTLFPTTFTEWIQFLPSSYGSPLLIGGVGIFLGWMVSIMKSTNKDDDGQRRIIRNHGADDQKD